MDAGRFPGASNHRLNSISTTDDGTPSELSVCGYSRRWLALGDLSNGRRLTPQIQRSRCAWMSVLDWCRASIGARSFARLSRRRSTGVGYCFSEACVSRGRHSRIRYVVSGTQQRWPPAAGRRGQWARSARRRRRWGRHIASAMDPSACRTTGGRVRAGCRSPSQPRPRGGWLSLRRVGQTASESIKGRRRWPAARPAGDGAWPARPPPRPACPKRHRARRSARRPRSASSCPGPPRGPASPHSP
jgi:hypothetical protein